MTIMDSGSSSAADHAENGKRLIARGDLKRGLSQFELALGLEPANPNLHVLMAWTLLRVGRLEEVEQRLETAIALDPALAVAYGMLGFRKRERGDFTGAIECFERGIELSPQQAGSYYGIVNSRRVTKGDEDLVNRMRQLAEIEALSAADKLFLHYGLGKAFDDLGQYEDAIRHYDIANRISATDPSLGSKPYDRQGHKRHIDLTIARYTKEFLSTYRGTRSSSDAPIFVVGMPRSGTTLVEQVVSSHPLVAAGGELLFWRDDSMRWRREIAAGIPDRSTARSTEKAYLDLLSRISNGEPRITDKMPINYLFLGAIHLLFPYAKIIHCRRHPVDTCLSIFMTRIVPPEFSNQRDNIVFCYQQYERLMAHWNAVIPSSQIFEVQYEQLVQAQESTTRALLQFCDLAWDEACLRPEANLRKLTTPSLWQARQPVYRSSLERWRNYEPWLGEFRELMPRL